MNLLAIASKIPHGMAVIGEWLGSGGVVVPKEEAQRRANICNGDNPSGRRCVHNDQNFVPTETVALAVKKYLEVKNGVGLRVNGEKILGTCAVCSCVLRLQVWEPQDKVYRELSEAEQESLPSFCWKKQQPTT